MAADCQEYLRPNLRQAYGQVVIAPKVTKFRKRYLEKLLAQGVSAPLGRGP